MSEKKKLCGCAQCEGKEPITGFHVFVEKKLTAEQIAFQEVLDAKNTEIARLEKEIKDFRSIDRHKDKDWGKWYKLYHAKCDEVARLEEALKKEKL